MPVTEGKAVPYYKAGGPVRGTQSFVHTLSSCWSRPSLTGLEVLWRWVYGVPALWLTASQVRQSLAPLLGKGSALAALGLDRALLNDPVGSLTADPVGVVGRFEHAAGIIMPDLLRLAAWLVPLLVIVWIVVSSIGRTIVLRRADASLKSRVRTLMLLQAIRLCALAGSFWVWFACIRAAARVAVMGPMSEGQEPNLVLYCAMTIVTTLGLFVLWGVVSWFFSIAPMLAMIRGLGVAGSLKAAMRLGALKSKLVEINLVMGIVKIALIVLAMVFSASPLPFNNVATQTFLTCWWIGVGLLYFAMSDYFHVVRVAATLSLWRRFDPETSAGASTGGDLH